MYNGVCCRRLARYIKWIRAVSMKSDDASFASMIGGSNERISCRFIRINVRIVSDYK